MQKLTCVLSVTAFLMSLAAWLRPTLPGAQAAPRPAASWQAIRNYPPLVFTSKAWLDCSISSTANGRQIMRTLSGQGFTFDTAMLPIKDGRVQVKKPGMLYKFDAFPTAAVPAKFNGLGEGRITEMKAEVEVDVKRFQQPGGPGTNIRFQASDINPDAAYVEFTGVWVRQRDDKPFPFRVLFGSVTQGGGNVTPGGPGRDTRLMSKAVQLGSPQQPVPVMTALYEAEDDVAPLK